MEQGLQTPEVSKATSVKEFVCMGGEVTVLFDLDLFCLPLIRSWAQPDLPKIGPATSNSKYLYTHVCG